MICGTHDDADGQAVAAWFGQVVGKDPHGPYAAMGWQTDGQFRTAVLFNDFNGSNIEMHMVGKVGRHALRDALRYAFLQLKVLRLTWKPLRSSVALREVVVGLGGVPEGVMARYYGPTPGDDAMIYRLDREAAEKWMA